jgi:hypothetical protein
MEETAEPITAANLTSLAIADDVRTGKWIRRLQPKRPVRTMTVVVVDIDPEHTLQVPSPDDQQPVKTLGPYRPDPSLREGVRVGRLHRVTSISAPSERNTSKLRENFASRSRSTKRSRRLSSSNIRASSGLAG